MGNKSGKPRHRGSGQTKIPKANSVVPTGPRYVGAVPRGLRVGGGSMSWKARHEAEKRRTDKSRLHREIKESEKMTIEKFNASLPRTLPLPK